MRLWSLADGSCLRTFEGHQASVLRLDFLSAGTQLLSAGADGLLKLWSVRLSGGQQPRVACALCSGPAGFLAPLPFKSHSLDFALCESRSACLHAPSVPSPRYSPVPAKQGTVDPPLCWQKRPLTRGSWPGTAATFVRVCLRAEHPAECPASLCSLLPRPPTPPHPPPAECINTFDAHDDKVWAMALSGASGDLVASGGGDGAIAVWEDCTAADADEAAAAAAAVALKEQDLANALQVGFF